MKKSIFTFILASTILFSSCQKQEVNENPSEVLADTQQEDKISKETLEKIAALNFNSNEVEIIERTILNGQKEESYLIEGDIILSKEQLEEMQPANITSKQYRTYNLVSSPRTINIIGFTGSGYGQGLTSKQQTALQRAVQNFNDLSIGLNFNLSFGTNYSAYDIVVFQESNGQAGGVAGFPSNGDPYKWVTIFSGMESYSTSTNEHVITHEIGHSLGLRHTDWFSRQSCGQSGEGADPDGAVYIPGTPEGFDSNSLMLACFSANESGNFGYYDEVALEYLY
jgi:hypothetical protein